MRSVAERLLASAPVALRRIKENLNDAEDVSFSQALIREAERHVRTGGTEDAREAGAAFREKRTPVFKGR
jgi:2-(1,2-epoxy-1,2-dihydrophenyl)acetyl-CoA isomerase